MEPDITLQPMTRELCHQFYQEFENDPAIYADMSRFGPYVYDEAAVDRRFQAQQTADRRAFLIMLGERPVGEIILKRIDWEKRSCSLSIHMANDSVKNRGYGTRAERLALRYAFNELDLLSVDADAVRKNRRSQHVLEKVGFRWVGEDDTFLYYRCEREGSHAGADH